MLHDHRYKPSKQIHIHVHKYTHKCLSTAHMEEKLYTYKRKTPYPVSIIPQTLQDNSEVLSERKGGRLGRGRESRRSFHSEVKIHKKESRANSSLSKKGKEREKDRGGGKTRQRLRGRLEERVKSKCWSNARGENGRQSGPEEKEGWVKWQENHV